MKSPVAISFSTDKQHAKNIFSALRKSGLVENKDIFYHKTADGKEAEEAAGKKKIVYVPVWKWLTK